MADQSLPAQSGPGWKVLVCPVCDREADGMTMCSGRRGDTHPMAQTSRVEVVPVEQLAMVNENRAHLSREIKRIRIDRDRYRETLEWLLTACEMASGPTVPVDHIEPHIREALR